MNSKIFNYKLSWLIGKICLCGQVDKRVDPEVGVQVQMSKKEILEYSVKCVVEGLGMRIWKDGATWKIRWEDEGGVGKTEGRKQYRVLF